MSDSMANTPIRVGINGFGRIGRNFFRAVQAANAPIEIVAVNDLGNIKTMAHLLKYDSVLGVLPNVIKPVDDGISIDGKVLKVLQHRDPKDLPWAALGVDVVIESTGFFTDRDKAAAHLDAGAPIVIVSAPSAGADATFVFGVNHQDFDRSNFSPGSHSAYSFQSLFEGIYPHYQQLFFVTTFQTLPAPFPILLPSPSPTPPIRREASEAGLKT